MQKPRKLPRDANALAARIVAISTGQADSEPPPQIAKEKNPAAVELGRLGGLKGGKARAEKLCAARRKAIARKAAAGRWDKRKR